MKKNFHKQSGSTFDDETHLILEKTEALTKIDTAEPKKKKNGKATKKWNLLKIMLRAFRLKRGKSSHVSFMFELQWKVFENQ